MKEKKCKSIFSCNIKKLSFYPFLLPVIYMFFRFFKDQFINSSYPKNLKMLKYNLPYMFYLYFPKIFAIIFIPIIKYNTKGESQEENRITKRYHFVQEHENKKKMIFFINIISLLEVIQENGDLLLYYYERIGYIQWLVEKKTGLIVFVPILCYLFLKIELFHHHILALIIGFIGVFIINFCRFPFGFSCSKDYPFHLLNIFFSFVLSLAFVLTKYVMIKNVNITPYLYVFYNGVFNIINLFLYILLEYFVVQKLPVAQEDNAGNYFAENYLGIITILKGQEKNFYIYIFLIMILLFVYYIINALTIYNFNPYLIIIVETCLPIDNDMIEIFYKKNVFNQDKILKRSLFQFIGYLIIILSALILNEIIILNFCNLNKNIRSNISARSRIEVDEIFNPEDESNYDGNISNDMFSEKST